MFLRGWPGKGKVVATRGSMSSQVLAYQTAPCAVRNAARRSGLVRLRTSGKCIAVSPGIPPGQDYTISQAFQSVTVLLDGL